MSITNKIYFTFCSWLVATASAFCQYTPDNYPIATITPDQFIELLHACRNPIYGLPKERIMMIEAIESRRQDLVRACLIYDGQNEMVRQAAKLPDSDARTLAVITMLRTDDGFWPRDNEESIVMGSKRLSMLTERWLLVEPFVSTFKKHLPNTKLTVENMRYKASRAKLADELEAAFKPKSVGAAFPVTTPEESKPSTTSTQAPSVRPISTSQPATPSTATSNPAIIEPLNDEQSQPSIFVWGTAVTMIAVLVVWLLKAREA